MYRSFSLPYPSSVDTIRWWWRKRLWRQIQCKATHPPAERSGPISYQAMTSKKKAAYHLSLALLSGDYTLPDLQISNHKMLVVCSSWSLPVSENGAAARVGHRLTAAETEIGSRKWVSHSRHVPCAFSEGYCEGLKFSSSVFKMMVEYC